MSEQEQNNKQPTLAEANRRIEALESWINDLQNAFLEHTHLPNGECVGIKRWGKQ